MSIISRSCYESMIEHLTYSLAKDIYSATQRDKYHAVVLSVRDQLVQNWMRTQQYYYEIDAKRAYYLSLEFLLGRLLDSYINNLGLTEEQHKTVACFGISYEDLLELEWDAGLGNGGLGRLAACFMDSLATLQYPAYGYGIRYEYGIFAQKIKNGYQIETPDNWLRYGNPWEFPRPEVLYPVKFKGWVETVTCGSGRMYMSWRDTDEVMAMAYDYPIPGYRNRTVNTLRLWSAKSSREFDLEYFNSGDYIKAMENKNYSETISKVLYPDDQSLAGKELRLKQQYFFVAATLKDIVRRYKKQHKNYKSFPDKVAIQLNDTHPSIAIAELMRILVDEEGIGWEDSWDITKRSIAYTNHTVLPEALEIWSEGLFAYLLPRHLQIIKEIDRRFIIEVKEKFPDSIDINNVAIVTGQEEKFINMARLSIVGSHTINGVSELHSEILKNNIFPEFYKLYPEKFINITNGITHRRWLIESNRPLTKLICEAIGDGWMKDLGELKKLEKYADDKEFCNKFMEIKRSNKESLSKYLSLTNNISFKPNFMLDCQIKRFHEYKRQLLNILHVITIYNRIREGQLYDNFLPRTVLFAGKSAPGYYICKLIIKLIHSVSNAIEEHPAVKEKLQVVFVPNYGVSLAQKIIPAADLSEQISTAGYEASGTGNMKFTMNGALTIGTLDGANIEIMQDVGHDNFFSFGHTAQDILELRKSYNPYKYYEENHELRQALNQLLEGHFSPENKTLFHPIVRSLLDHDRFFVLADYESYISCQERISEIYKDNTRWSKMAILNIARSSKFTSDRAIQEYAEKIWKIQPVDYTLKKKDDFLVCNIEQT
ncbi:MAG: glycogen/starch/alpha-glucan phosphorylase [Thermodesulfovibrionales bacterium]|nr:glycogen/starch/alpha-glucan phosphorylase [Thermodesulfovibrionales bacterium]